MQPIIHSIKKYWIYTLFLVAVLIFTATRLWGINAGKKERARLSMKTILVGSGWGYELLLNDHVYIHQEYMPAIAGRKSFNTEPEARLIGTLALAKMKHSSFPVITVAELDSCHITR